MTDLESVLGKTGAKNFWKKVWGNVKTLTGDVEFKTKGDLQTQINNVANTASAAKTAAEEAKTTAEDAKVAAGEIVTDNTDKFDPEKDYAVGDYAIYDNKAWEFTTAHPAGEWDESHVKQTTILAEIAAQNKNSSYSTEETVCGTWIDGRPIYRKVFFAESLSANSPGIDYSYGIVDALSSGLKPLRLYGMGEDHTDNLHVPLNLYNSDAYVLYNACLYVSGTNIILRATKLLKNIYVILEYVKS